MNFGLPKTAEDSRLLRYIPSMNIHANVQSLVYSRKISRVMHKAGCEEVEGEK